MSWDCLQCSCGSYNEYCLPMAETKCQEWWRFAIGKAIYAIYNSKSTVKTYLLNVSGFYSAAIH